MSTSNSQMMVDAICHAGNRDRELKQRNLDLEQRIEWLEQCVAELARRMEELRDD